MVIPAGGNEEQIGQEWFVLTRNGYVCVSSVDAARDPLLIPDVSSVDAAHDPLLIPERVAARLAAAWGSRLPELIAALQRMGER